MDRSYRRVDGTEPPEWLSEGTADGFDQIVARLTLTGARLRIETVGDRRMDDVLAKLRELDLLTIVVSDDRRRATSDLSA